MNRAASTLKKPKKSVEPAASSPADQVAPAPTTPARRGRREKVAEGVIRQQLEAYVPIGADVSEAKPQRVSLRKLGVAIADGNDKPYRFAPPLVTFITKSGWSKAAGGYGTALYGLHRPKIPKRIDFTVEFHLDNQAPLGETRGLDLTRMDRTITNDVLEFFEERFAVFAATQSSKQQVALQAMMADLRRRKHEFVMHLARTFPFLLEELFDAYPNLEGVRYIAAVAVKELPDLRLPLSKVFTMRFNPDRIELYNPSALLQIAP